MIILVKYVIITVVKTSLAKQIDILKLSFELVLPKF